MKLRIKFSKHGVLKFIGHLDVMRYFQKAIRRAGIDVSYTGGFSPHQKMSFAAPLGVGLESNGEYMDIEVNSLTSSRDIIDSLNGQMADGIKILEAKLLPDNAGNAMASVFAAKYTIAFRKGYLPEFMSEKSVMDFYSKSEINVTKKTKKSEATFDMKPYIYDLKFDLDSHSLSMTVDASSANNIKPSLVVKALCEDNGYEFCEYGLLITREETYTDNFVPLGLVGSDY